jgi:hypothetical protein
MCNTLYTYLRIPLEQPPVHRKPPLAELEIIVLHVQSGEARILLHCGHHVPEADAGLRPTTGEVGCCLQKMHYEPESLFIRKRFSKGMAYLLRTAQASVMNTSFLVPGRVQVLTIVFSALATSSITLGPTVMLVR